MGRNLVQNSVNRESYLRVLYNVKWVFEKWDFSKNPLLLNKKWDF